MSIVHRSLDTYTGLYDFAVDGGAIGTIDLGVPVPANTLIIEFGFYVLAFPADGGGGPAQISFDTIETDTNPVIINIGQLYISQPINLIMGSYVNFGIIPYKFGLIPPPPDSSINLIYAFNISMSISVVPLIAGKLFFFLRGITIDVT
jgi:hypothetical protein